MVVSINIYEVLNVAILLLAIAYLVFLFVKRNETYSIVIRLICAFALVVIEAFKMPMDISMDKSCANAIFMIILWLVNVVICSFQLGQDVWTTKKENAFFSSKEVSFFYKFYCNLLEIWYTLVNWLIFISIVNESQKSCR